jgi:LacI family transcriptional regulator
MPRVVARAESRRRKRGPTILDVARRAGVSLGTVSNVLNDRVNVSAARRTAVEDAIAALRYVPNGLAQGLRRQSSRVVGLCAPLTSSAYFAAMLDAFEDIAAAQGYEVMQVLSRRDPALEFRRVRALIARQVDGLILIPSAAPQATFDLIAASALPTVIVDRLSDDRRFDYVTLDDYGAMTEAAQALLSRGHRRLIYFVRSPAVVTTQRRIAAFKAAAAKVRGARAEVCVRDPDDAVFARQFDAIMTRVDRPTAIITSNSALTLALLRMLKARGFLCPRDFSMIAFDAPDWAEVTTPAISVVRPPTDVIARKAWELLLRRMQKPGRRTEHVALHATLELRESVAAPGVRARSRTPRPVGTMA